MPQPSGKAWMLKVARIFFLQHPVAFAVFTGVVVVVTSLGVGLSLERFP